MFVDVGLQDTNTVHKFLEQLRNILFRNHQLFQGVKNRSKKVWGAFMFKRICTNDIFHMSIQCMKDNLSKKVWKWYQKCQPWLDNNHNSCSSSVVKDRHFSSKHALADMKTNIWETYRARKEGSVVSMHQSYF